MTIIKNPLCIRVLHVVVLFLFTTNVIIAQTKAEKIDEVMSLYSEYGQFNGSILVAEKGKVIYKKGFGLANMEWNIPNQPNTKHRLGSITKQFTAMLIIQLVEQGKLELDVPITKYLSDYPKMTGDQITIHHLLTHTAGIPNYTSFSNFYNQHSRNHFEPEEFVRVFADSTLHFTPGEKFEYSNSGYFLLGYIIEKVSGKSYEQMLQDNIFTPLKMNDTGYDHHKTIIQNRASGYEKYGISYNNAAYLDMSLPYAAGSMYSTTEDLYLWDRALYNNQLVSEKYKDLIFTPHIKAGKRNYGYGWSVGYELTGIAKDSVNMIEHGGGINGFNTNIARIPQDQHLIVLLNNTGRTSLQNMRDVIINILYDAPYEKPKKSLASSYFEVVTKEGIKNGTTYFKKYKSSDEYILHEAEMNTIGYIFLKENKIEEAIKTFEINVEAFPDSGNVYDSLGEAYMINGDKELAIKNYNKSLEIDPKNENAVKMLVKLKKF